MECREADWKEAAHRHRKSTEDAQSLCEEQQEALFSVLFDLPPGKSQEEQPTHRTPQSQWLPYSSQLHHIDRLPARYRSENEQEG